MTDLICTHCGGQISPRNMKCEYCGTQYKAEHDQVFRIETYQSPIETFAAEALMPNEEIQFLGAERASEFAIRRLTDKLVECVAPMMKIETEYDYGVMAQRVRATIKVVRPAK